MKRSDSHTFKYLCTSPVSSRPLPQLLLHSEHESLVPEPAATPPAPSVNRHTPTHIANTARPCTQNNKKTRRVKGMGWSNARYGGLSGPEGQGRMDATLKRRARCCLPSGQVDLRSFVVRRHAGKAGWMDATETRRRAWCCLPSGQVSYAAFSHENTYATAWNRLVGGESVAGNGVRARARHKGLQ